LLLQRSKLIWFPFFTVSNNLIGSPQFYTNNDFGSYISTQCWSGRW
jgi:hypothetical protein